MFTGIIEEIGTVKQIRQGTASAEVIVLSGTFSRL